MLKYLHTLSGLNFAQSRKPAQIITCAIGAIITHHAAAGSS